MKKIWLALLAVIMCISFMPENVQAAGNPFIDVRSSQYYYYSVLWAVQDGVTTGKTPTSFAPDDSCLRSQVVTFLHRYADKPDVSGVENVFEDISTKDYFYNAVLWAVEKDITEGMDETHFGPDDVCTRAQAVTFLWRFCGTPEPKSAKSPFTDISEEEYYYQAVLWAQEKGITTGKTNTTFAPDELVTRSQFVTFLWRLDGKPTPSIPFNEYEEYSLTWNSGWQYANYSKIHTDGVTLYKSVHEGRPVICINAGHGTKGGNSVRTLCHPDGSAKVTGGSTSAGSTTAAAVSSGTTMLDGTAEAVVNLRLALIVRDRLLEKGYSVLMIRESDDVQLDNIARTVFANNNADCHIAIHYDSTTNNKGFFYIGVPNISSYRSMEPVASHWQQHNALGESILSGMRSNGVKIYSSGNIPMDLTQTSYSTVPSIDIEVGDRGSDYSTATLNKLASGIVDGVKNYFGEPK